MLLDKRGTFYMIGEKKLPCLYLTLEQVKETLVEVGLVIVVHGHARNTVKTAVLF